MRLVGDKEESINHSQALLTPTPTALYRTVHPNPNRSQQMQAHEETTLPELAAHHEQAKGILKWLLRQLGAMVTPCQP